MHFCRYFHEDSLPDRVRTDLEESLYQTLHGPNKDDRDTADAPTEPHDTGVSESVPDPLSRTIDRLAQTVTFGSFTAGNARLSERISHEAIHWVGDKWRELEENDPLSGEEAALHTLRDSGTLQIDDIAENAAKARPELRRAADVAVRSSGTEPHPLVREAYARELLDRWQDALSSERDNHRARELGRSLGQFVRELGRIVPRLAEQQAAVRDALGNEDALWDLSMHEWEELPIGGLEEAATTLRDVPELRELASILGKSKAVSEERTVMREHHNVRLRPVGIGRSEVTGIRAGSEIETLLASELALLAQPETEELFFAKLADGQLFSLEYNRERLVEDVETTLVPTREEVMVPRGPVVVCVDTSGSMLGFPERIAKATVLALARELAVAKRPLEVIAFSSQVKSFSLAYDDHDHHHDHEHEHHEHHGADLGALARFLTGSFHGGTDLHKALESAVEAVDRDGLRHADVLVISDFRVPKIADRYMARINRAHRRGTLFHALTVAMKPVIDPLHLFDSTWLCNTSTGRIDPGMLRRI